MKVKGLLAAVLGCVALLTGCGNDTGNGEMSSSSITSTSVFSTVESSEQGSSTTEFEQSSSLLQSEPKDVDYYIPKINLFEAKRLIIDPEGMVTLSFGFDVPFMEAFEDDVNYYLRVYWNDSQWGESKLIYDEPYDTDLIPWVHCKAEEGANYYYIQLYTDDKEGETSNELYYNTENENADSTPVYTTPSDTETPQVHQYTHTFDAPSGITVVPDYALALSQIQEGMQPGNFYAKIYYTCPLCGMQKEVGSNHFNYSFDSSYTVLNILCRNVKCINSKSSWRAKINCYAVQIS